MKKKQIESLLRQEAQTYTPDVPVDLSLVRPVPEGETAVAVKKRPMIWVLLPAFLALLLFVAVLLPLLLPAGGGAFGTIVISVDPASGGAWQGAGVAVLGEVPLSLREEGGGEAVTLAELSAKGRAPTAEFTVKDGKVTGTRALNRDAAVFLVEKDFNGIAAEEACVGFAELARERNLLGGGGIRIRVTGENSARLSNAVYGALGSLFSVGELDEETFSALMAGYNAGEMEDFEDFLLTEYAGQRDAYLARVRELLDLYPEGLARLTPTAEAVAAFNQTFTLLGEDFLIELDDDWQSEWEETVEELREEYREISQLLERDPQKAFEELFDGFAEVIEDKFDQRHERDDDDDDDDRDDD